MVGYNMYIIYRIFGYKYIFHLYLNTNIGQARILEYWLGRSKITAP